MEKKIGPLGRWIRSIERMPDLGVPVIFYDVRLGWTDIGDLRPFGVTGQESDGPHFWTPGRIPSPLSVFPAKYVTHWQPLRRPSLSDYERQLRDDFRKDLKQRLAQPKREPIALS